MLKEIPFQEGKIVFFKDSGFWNELLTKCKKDTRSIQIATYNFNFRDKYERTFYKELEKIANSGVAISLIYAKMSFFEQDQFEIEEIFKNFVLCGELPTNHSKIFITDDFAYIGSANFSFSSNYNYECGVIFEDVNIISKIQKFFREELLEMSDFKNVPEIFDPFDLLENVEKSLKQLSNLKVKDELYYFEIRESIPGLRYLDDIKVYIEKLDYPLPIDFDWWDFYMLIDSRKPLTDSDFNKFIAYLSSTSKYIVDFKQYLKTQYQEIGRTELLRKIRVIK